MESIILFEGRRMTNWYLFWIIFPSLVLFTVLPCLVIVFLGIPRLVVINVGVFFISIYHLLIYILIFLLILRMHYEYVVKNDEIWKKNIFSKKEIFYKPIKILKITFAGAKDERFIVEYMHQEYKKKITCDYKSEEQLKYIISWCRSESIEYFEYR